MPMILDRIMNVPAQRLACQRPHRLSGVLTGVLQIRLVCEIDVTAEPGYGPIQKSSTAAIAAAEVAFTNRETGTALARPADCFSLINSWNTSAGRWFSGHSP